MLYNIVVSHFLPIIACVSCSLPLVSLWSNPSIEPFENRIYRSQSISIQFDILFGDFVMMDTSPSDSVMKMVDPKQQVSQPDWDIERESERKRSGVLNVVISGLALFSDGYNAQISACYFYISKGCFLMTNPCGSWVHGASIFGTVSSPSFRNHFGQVH